MMESTRGKSTDKSSAFRHRQCALCLDKFKSPRILPCFHTFCLACLEQLVKAEPCNNIDFPCPTCRQMTPIPPTGVGQFQVNFYVEAEIEALNLQSSTTVINCDMCGGVPVTHKCSDCNQFACASCLRIHGTIAATRTHTVLNLDSLKKEGNKDTLVIKERFCSAHSGEKIRFFCTACNCVICRYCKLTSHEGHKTTDLPQKAAEAKEILVTVTQKSRQNLQPLLLQVLGEAEKLQHELGSQRQEILTTLQQRADELRLAVDLCLKNAESKLCMVVDDAEKVISDSVQEMQQQLTCFVSLLEHVESVTSSGSDADVLELPAQVHKFFGETQYEDNRTLCLNKIGEHKIHGKGYVTRGNALCGNPKLSSSDLVLSQGLYDCRKVPSINPKRIYGGKVVCIDGSCHGMAYGQGLVSRENSKGESMTTLRASQNILVPLSVGQHLKIFTDANWRIGISVVNFNQKGEHPCLLEGFTQNSQIISNSKRELFTIPAQNKIQSSPSLQTLTSQMASYIGDVQKTINNNQTSISVEKQIIAPEMQKTTAQRDVYQNINVQIMQNVSDINNIIDMWMTES